MTDLERALLQAYRDAWEALIPNGPSHQVMFALKIAPLVDAALAAARREGAEETAEEWRGKLAEQCGKTLAAAYEMRERAALEVTDMWFRGVPAQDFGKRLLDLPLTPEEPV